jgi:hypothetical protein
MECLSAVREVLPRSQTYETKRLQTVTPIVINQDAVTDQQAYPEKLPAMSVSSEAENAWKLRYLVG